jgi:hypothetical protein
MKGLETGAGMRNSFKNYNPNYGVDEDQTNTIQNTGLKPKQKSKEYLE